MERKNSSPPRRQPSSASTSQTDGESLRPRRRRTATATTTSETDNVGVPLQHPPPTATTTIETGNVSLLLQYPPPPATITSPTNNVGLPLQYPPPSATITTQTDNVSSRPQRRSPSATVTSETDNVGFHPQYPPPPATVPSPTDNVGLLLQYPPPSLAVTSQTAFHGLPPQYLLPAAMISPINRRYSGLDVVAAAAETLSRMERHHSDNSHPDYSAPSTSSNACSSSTGTRANVPSPGTSANVPSPGTSANVPSPGASAHVPSPGASANVPAPSARAYVPAPSPPDDPSSPDDSSSDGEAASPGPASPSGAGTSGRGGRKRKAQPYVPSYMDATKGPYPCAVCGDAATGYHYRCITCEGCKGFFRRTIQKDLTYHCKYSQNCVIDKSTRNQCQECRFNKCEAVGMARDLVLNEQQRKAKRKLIEDNRERRRVEEASRGERSESQHQLTDADRNLISATFNAYYNIPVDKLCEFRMLLEGGELGRLNLGPEYKEFMNTVSEIVTFGKYVPGFEKLEIDDQIALMRASCVENVCLKLATRFNPSKGELPLTDGMILRREQLDYVDPGMRQLFNFAEGLHSLKLDSTEIALLAAVVLLQSDRSGLMDPPHVDEKLDAVLFAFQHYVAEKRPHQAVRWAKILMKVTDIRNVSNVSLERLFQKRITSERERYDPNVVSNSNSNYANGSGHDNGSSHDYGSGQDNVNGLYNGSGHDNGNNGTNGSTNGTYDAKS